LDRPVQRGTGDVVNDELTRGGLVKCADAFAYKDCCTPSVFPFENYI
jgi:hypothetical protein